MAHKKCLDYNTLSAAYSRTIQNNSGSTRNINLCFGVCRSGTTALAQVYGKAGFRSFYQPVKADFRLISNGDIPVNFRKVCEFSTRGAFFKETIGPFFPFETEIDFLAWYEMLGVNLKQSHFIVAFRDPAGTFASWLKCWNKVRPTEQLFDTYVKAECASARIEQTIIDRGFKISYYCHHFSQAGIQKFDSLFLKNTPAIPFDSSFLRNWHTTNLSRSKVNFPIEPPFFVREEIHETTPFFCAPPGTYAKFSNSEYRTLLDMKIIDNYDRRVSLAAKQ